MESLPVSELRAIDRKAKQIGLDERLLIENASSNLFSVIHELNLGKHALVICGRGNNGADVLSCARKLFCRGYAVEIVTVWEKEPGVEVSFQIGVLEKIGAAIYNLSPDKARELKEHIKDCDFIVEGILGIGVKGQVTGFIKQVIEEINKSGKKIIACDIPSGLSPDDGKVLGAAIKADVTVSFIALKEGFSSITGKEHCGKVVVVDIGVSAKVLNHAR